MSLEKITTQQMDAKGVCSAPDVLSGTPAQNKAVFDRMVRELVAPAYNAAVDAINAMENTEDGVKAAEALRVEAEKLRAAAETARAEAESGRAEAEQQRQDAETQRQDLETGYVARSENGAKASESWAVGGTGIREGEDTNNAKYWSEKAKETAGGEFVPTSEKGKANGVATLGADGKVPSGQLPSLDYVPNSEKGKENGVATLGADGKVPAEQVDAYSKSESISAETRTALSLAETATPDAALAEIARQLSESGGVELVMLWENASPNSAFADQTISLDLSDYGAIAVFSTREIGETCGALSTFALVGGNGACIGLGNYGAITHRNFIVSQNGVTFDKAMATDKNGTKENGWAIPTIIYGIKGIA